MPDPTRRHYAVGLQKVKGGWKVSVAVERPSRAEADKSSLSLVAYHDDARGITLDREIRNGEVLDAAALKR
jgi:hypothetical protein